MPAKAQEIFAQIAASVSANHFRISDLPLLEQYAVAAHLSSFYAARIGETDGATTKLMVSLATKLRLAPSARSDPKTVARYEPPPTSPPWDNANAEGARG